MEEKLRKEKQEKEEEAAGKVTAENNNEVDDVSSEKPEEEKRSASAHDIIAYTPGPVRVPTVESSTTEAKPVSEIVSELPPVPQNVVEQERLEMIEVNNDGTSGHLTHSLE